MQKTITNGFLKTENSVICVHGKTVFFSPFQIFSSCLVFRVPSRMRLSGVFVELILLGVHGIFESEHFVFNHIWEASRHYPSIISLQASHSLLPFGHSHDRNARLWILFKSVLPAATLLPVAPGPTLRGVRNGVPGPVGTNSHATRGTTVRQTPHPGGGRDYHSHPIASERTVGIYPSSFGC